MVSFSKVKTFRSLRTFFAEIGNDVALGSGFKRFVSNYPRIYQFEPSIFSFEKEAE